VAQTETIGFRAVLRHRDFRRLAGGFAISQAGDWLYNVALVVFVYDQTHSATWVAITTALRLAPWVLLGALGGAIADRYDRKKVMIACDLARAGMMGLLAVVAAAHGPAIVAGLAAFASTAFGAPYMPSVDATNPTLVGEDHLPAANSLMSAIQNVAIIVGPAIGALLLVLGSPALAFLLNGVSFAFGALLVSTIRADTRPDRSHESEHASALERIAAGFNALTHSSTAALLVGIIFAASFIYGTDTVLYVFIGKQVGTGVNGIGYLFAALGAGGVVSVFATNRLAAKPRLGSILLAGLAVYCLPTAIMPFVHSPGVAVAVQAVRGAGNIVLDVLTITALQRSLPNDVLGRVFGIVNSVAVGGILAGSLITPALVSAFGVSTTLFVWAFAYPALGVLALPRILALDRETTHRLRVLMPRIRTLETAGIFASTPRPVVEALAAAADEVSLPARIDVVRQGDEPDFFYVLSEGAVEVLVAAYPGDPGVVVATLGPGDYFGEIGLLRGIRRTASVRTLENSRLLRISGQGFLEAVNASPGGSPALAEGVATRFARSLAASDIEAG